MGDELEEKMGRGDAGVLLRASCEPVEPVNISNVFDRDVDQPLLLDQQGCDIIYRTQHAPPSSLTL